jgi:large subunit ribosomal protein L41
MRPTSLLRGASRLPLTPKRGNKDFYKGTGQSYAPGGGHRTGPPGKFIVKGKGKYRIVDSKVRYFVGPGIEKIESSFVSVKSLAGEV